MKENSMLAAGEMRRRRRCTIPDEKVGGSFGFLLLLSRFVGTTEQVWDYIVHW